MFNEKPQTDELALVDPKAQVGVLPRGAILHTTMGDIVIKLFADECPRTVENFSTHARNGYYDSVIFHRVIQGFMIQTGDPDGTHMALYLLYPQRFVYKLPQHWPAGDGTGGESIWGGEFEDEFHRALRHDRPFTVGMQSTY